MIVSEQVSYINKKDGTVKWKSMNEKSSWRYTLWLKCDECTLEYKTLVSNYRTRKTKNIDSLDLCSFCRKKGERNPSFGKDRSLVLIRARSFQKTNGMKGKRHTVEARRKMSISKTDAIANGTFNIKSNNRGRKTWYYSTKNNCLCYADSILELARMHELDADSDIVSWTKRHYIRIPYVYNNNCRIYVPDFLIYNREGALILEEVKGRSSDIDLVKEVEAKNYCTCNNLVYVLTRSTDVKNYKNLIKETKCS